MYGQTRHRLLELVRRARGGTMTPDAIADALSDALDADFKLVQQAMARQRQAGSGATPAHTGNAAAMSVPPEDLGEADL